MSYPIFYWYYKDPHMWQGNIFKAIPLKKMKNYGLDYVIGTNEWGRPRGKVHKS